MVRMRMVPEPKPEPVKMAPETIYDPSIGVRIKTTDVGGMAQLYERMKKYADDAYTICATIRAVFKEMAPGKHATEFIQGGGMRVKVEHPGSVWNQAMLKDAWNRFPELRDRCMKIAEVGVNKTQFNKLDKTIEPGNPEFALFVCAIEAAKCESGALPRITVESYKETE